MSTRGFTLIETIVYLALFTIIIGGIVVASYALFESSDRNQTKAMMQEEENYLIGKINWVLNGAKIVSVPTQLSLNVTKYDGTTPSLAASGNDIQLNSVTLNNSNVTISHLVFIRTFAGGTNPESIEAGFTISAKTPNGMSVSEIASTTRYLHK